MIKGKQIVDNTIQQQKLNLVDPILNDDAATKNYVDENVSVQYNSQANKNMAALATTTDGDLATNTAIIDAPVSNTKIKVFINGNQVPNGDSASDVCYFSNDGGATKVVVGAEAIGDLLYWVPSVALYDLEVGDKVDFVYLTTS